MLGIKKQEEKKAVPREEKEYSHEGLEEKKEKKSKWDRGNERWER